MFNTQEFISKGKTFARIIRSPSMTQTNVEPPSVLVQVKDLEDFCMTALTRVGMPEDKARIVTNVLVTNDTFGVFTHGTRLLGRSIRRLQGGGLKAKGEPKVEKEGPGWAIVDGGSCVGMLTAVFAMKTAIEKAKNSGIGYVGVHNGCHFSAAGYYALMAAQNDMIGLAMANDRPTMTIPGGAGRILGTNPFAFAVPAGKEHPIFLDIATSAVSCGRVSMAKSRGEKVPDTWMVDNDGLPTTDISQFPNVGILQPMAGHKGYGIALMVETLSALISGAGITNEVENFWFGPADLPTRHGGAFIAINVGAMMPLDRFKARVDGLIQEMRQSPRAKGTSRIYLPGEMEWLRRENALRNGIQLPFLAMEQVQELCGELGLTLKTA
jgi:ureidoglycolate dehydrogenase (NAD+)